MRAAQPQSESFEITIGKSHTTKAGLAITLHERGHKHGAKGSSMSRWQLDITSNGKTESVEYSFTSGDLRWFLEGLAHGWIYSVDELTTDEELDKNSRRRVTLTPYSSPPLEPEMVWEKGNAMAAAEAKRRGCVGTGIVRSSRQTDGTVSYTVDENGQPLCHILVGVYSGKIFFKNADRSDGK